MPTYLYGLILGRNARLVREGQPGMRGSALRVVTCGPLGALVATLASAPSRNDIEDLKAHDAALQQVTQQGVTVVASRFGQVFDDDAALCRQLAERGEGATRALEAHDGFVEMRVLLRGDSDRRARDERTSSGEATGPGRAYLERLRGQPANAIDLSRHESLSAIVRSTKQEALPGSAGAEGGVVLAHLVHRDDAPMYREIVRGIPELANARIVGPLALFSFAQTYE